MKLPMIKPGKSLVSGVFAALFLFACAGAKAEPLDFSDMDLRFVDAREDAGYYVDMNSVDIKNMSEASARVEIVRIDAKKIYLYHIEFNRKLRTYRIMDSVSADYDTKEILGGSSVPLKAQTYAKGSAMEAVAGYLYSPQQ